MRAETHRFIYGVLDPFIHLCWGDFAIDCNEDDEPYVYLMGALFRKEVLFLVSGGAARDCEQCEDDLRGTSPRYQDEMRARILRAKNDP